PRSPTARRNSCPRSCRTNPSHETKEESAVKKTLALVVALALLASGAGPALAETTMEKIARTETLTIGTRTGSPPFGYVNSKNEWVGFSIELVEQLIVPSLSQKLGKQVKLEKKESTPPTRIPLL